MMFDTICAISSGMTESGIGIIRISGDESYNIINRIFSGNGKMPIDKLKPNRVRHGFIHNVSRETLDEVLVINMNAPHSYTGEDTIEIDCHGGMLMMRRILETVIEAGARPAEPGEFTKRAFLNGRIDLAQAEAVADVISSKTDDAARASIEQLGGRLSARIRDIRGKVLEDTAYIESALDDPEHYSLDDFRDRLASDIKDALKETENLKNSYQNGRLIKNGLNTVLLGKPNAGKSSLLNALLGTERAIVTKIPGTTRDMITESISIGPVLLNITDTAGIRKTEDEIESIGISKALERAKRADLVLVLIDSSKPIDDKDEEIISFVKENGLKAIFVLNKNDIADLKQCDVGIFDAVPHVSISALTQTGIDGMIELIKNMFFDGTVRQNDELIVTSLRHKQLLSDACSSLNSVLCSIESGLPEDFFTIDLMNAYTSLGTIIGEEAGEDLINEIFSKFCMGK